MADSLAMAQAELQAAVDGSERLQAEAARYGEDWLRNRIKVQVNVTNPADLSYWANSYFPVAGWPDNAIRDHRKIAFYDITEEDPYRGSATFSGMGVGEHYVGPNWEDRALVLSGPAALEVKNQARELLVSQGFDEERDAGASAAETVWRGLRAEARGVLGPGRGRCPGDAAAQRHRLPDEADQCGQGRPVHPDASGCGDHRSRLAEPQSPVGLDAAGQQPARGTRHHHSPFAGERSRTGLHDPVAGQRDVRAHDHRGGHSVR